MKKILVILFLTSKAFAASSEIIFEGITPAGNPCKVRLNTLKTGFFSGCQEFQQTGKHTDDHMHATAIGMFFPERGWVPNAWIAAQEMPVAELASQDAIASTETNFGFLIKILKTSDTKIGPFILHDTKTNESVECLQKF